MLYGNKVAVCFDYIYTKHINTLCGKKIEFFIVTPGGTYYNHWALKGKSKL